MLKDPSALSVLEQAVDRWRQKGNRAGEAGVLVTMSDAKRRVGEVDEAKRLLRDALLLREDLQDMRGQAEAQMKLASLQGISNKEVAIESYTRVLSLRHELQDQYGEAEAYNALGLLYGDLSRMEEVCYALLL